MPDNAQKTPFNQSLGRFARGTVLAATQQEGKSLPCSVVKVRGAIVQVKFEVQSGYTLPNVTIPIIGSEYIRVPIQPGCKGFVIAADAYLGGMSGLGGGVADLTKRGNLTALVFAPIGNSSWTTVDGNVLVFYGPSGVTLRDQASNTTITLTPTGVTVARGGVSLAITGSDITATTPKFVIATLPTSPGSSGQLWRDGSGTVKVS